MSAAPVSDVVALPPGRSSGFLRSLVTKPAKTQHGHWYAIDLARGIAAIVVLFWHYQHFFFVAGAKNPSIPRDAQPLYQPFSLLYTNGFYAVQFFWLISGFVFAGVYLHRRTTTRSFVVNRFARLYPLHFVTLLVVLALQVLSMWAVGHEQIYVNNDFKHFALNLAFASHWGFENGYSFNGPTWSVSIEILAYALFWVTLPLLYRWGVIGPTVLAGACWLIHYHTTFRGDADLLRCSCFFFAGVAVFLLVAGAARRPWPLVMGAVVLVALSIAVIEIKPHSAESIGVPLLMTGILLMLCAIEAAEFSQHLRILSWIGDNTYGTYLWHVPIQIATLIVLDRFVGSHAIALSPWFLLGFITVTIVVARLSFLFIEAPARERLRRLA